MKWKRLWTVVASILVLSVIGAIGSCGVLLWQVKRAIYVREEIARVTSPDGKVDAVLIRGNGGAMTPFSYEAYLVAHGRIEPRDSDRVFAGRSGDVQFHWLNIGQLQIDYDKYVHVIDFDNHWWHPNHASNDYTPYEVILERSQVLPPPK